MPPANVRDIKQARAAVDELEKALAGHLFLGGAKPAKEDVDKFYEMFGEHNIAFYRWVRNMASFTESERKSWGLPETPRTLKVALWDHGMQCTLARVAPVALHACEEWRRKDEVVGPLAAWPDATVAGSSWTARM
ncbi:hypothetical protein CGC20_2100 [Leishmania donovani]|uniref:Uncharacterized protein n=1 Tax=Leishmania donovani TaxID=5661 RepID=A0A504XNS8_LEIDO|nr:hypothetical protein CGC20_2100 [Leishmania donovani]